jgi:uncharacterized protein YbjT (DUF2867 family)
MSRTAVVIGATGLVGGYLVRQLLDDPAYSTVITYARKNLGIHHPKLVQKPFPIPDSPIRDVTGDDFYCSIGTTIKKAKSREAFRIIDFEVPLAFAKSAKEAGVSHFLLVSSVGADSKSPFFYPRIKGELEDAIGQLDFPSFTVVRPGLLRGPREEFRLGEKIGGVIQAVIEPILLGKLRDFRSVPAQDVARCLVEAAHHPQKGRRIISSGEIRRYGRTLVG